MIEFHGFLNGIFSKAFLLRHRFHPFGDGRRGGKSRRANADEVDEIVHLFAFFHNEVVAADSPYSGKQPDDFSVVRAFIGFFDALSYGVQPFRGYVGGRNLFFNGSRSDRKSTRLNSSHTS